MTALKKVVELIEPTFLFGATRARAEGYRRKSGDGHCIAIRLGQQDGHPDNGGGGLARVRPQLSALIAHLALRSAGEVFVPNRMRLLALFPLPDFVELTRNRTQARSKARVVCARTRRVSWDIQGDIQTVTSSPFTTSPARSPPSSSRPLKRLE